MVRFVVADEEAIRAAEDYEERAKALERAGRWDEDKRLRLTPLIEVLQRYEQRAGD